MQVLTERQLTSATANCPSVKDESSRLTDKAGQSVCGSKGTYHYYPVGSNRETGPNRGNWGGECFACWGSISPSRALQSITYQNVLSRKTIPRGTAAFYEMAWDTVIRPPFAEFLPTFKDLRTMSTITFSLQGRSLMEASLYFRLMRIFNECLSFAHSAGQLRQRYPEAPAAVLLAATSLGIVDRNDGYTGIAHPASPNNTIGGTAQILPCMSLVRNYEWATRNGGWRVEKFRTSKDTTSPFSRRYYGHDHYWFGQGRTFAISLDVTPRQSYKDRYFMDPWHVPEAGAYQPYESRWEPVRKAEGWTIMDRAMRLLMATYEATEGKEYNERIPVAIKSLFDEPAYRAYFGGKRRLY